MDAIVISYLLPLIIFQIVGYWPRLHVQCMSFDSYISNNPAALVYKKFTSCFFHGWWQQPEKMCCRGSVHNAMQSFGIALLPTCRSFCIGVISAKRNNNQRCVCRNMLHVFCAPSILSDRYYGREMPLQWLVKTYGQ